MATSSDAIHFDLEMSETAFMKQIGLIQTNEEHVRLFDQMKQEVAEGMEHLIYDRGSLLPHLANDQSIQPPYYNIQIDYMAFVREVNRIHANASQETREIYDSVAPQRNPDVGNAVVRWLLQRTTCNRRYW